MYSKANMKRIAGTERGSERLLAEWPIYRGVCYSRDGKFSVIVHKEPTHGCKSEPIYPVMYQTEWLDSEREAWRDAKEAVC